jgi:hypothetical protein
MILLPSGNFVTTALDNSAREWVVGTTTAKTTYTIPCSPAGIKYLPSSGRFGVVCPYAGSSYTLLYQYTPGTLTAAVSHSIPAPEVSMTLSSSAGIEVLSSGSIVTFHGDSTGAIVVYSGTGSGELYSGHYSYVFTIMPIPTPAGAVCKFISSGQDNLVLVWSEGKQTPLFTLESTKPSIAFAILLSGNVLGATVNSSVSTGESVSEWARFTACTDKGLYCSDASATTFPCTTPGYYCPHTAVSPTTVKPIPCPPGSYCSSGATEAAPCEAGTYNMEGGNGAPCSLKCPRGSMCPTGSFQP